MGVEIISIGFDGPNRAGKSTQSLLLQGWLAGQRIPSLRIRGAGSRSGCGDEPGDPPSTWWQAVNRWLRNPQTNYEAWDITSYRLARELIVWRDRVLPHLVKTQGKNMGVLLIDRSLLSRTMTLRARQLKDIAPNLYPAQARIRGRRISAEEVCPDLILNLTAPISVLLARLEPGDPKYEFRKRLISETSHWFQDATDHIPQHLKSRVVEVDASRSKKVVFADILLTLKRHFKNLAVLNEQENDSNES